MLSEELTRRTISWRIAVLLVSSAASHAIAQSGGPSVQLRGRLVDSLTRLPIVGATVEVKETDWRRTTDSTGRFSFGDQPNGQYVLRARHVGYREAIDTIHISASEGKPSVEHELALWRLPRQLDEAVVSGRTVRFSAFFADAYKRAAGGRGFFVTREEIDELNANDYQMILNRIPGVSANDRGVTFPRCQSGLTKLGDQRIQAKVQVWIDGYHMPASTDPQGVYDTIRSVKPQSIQIMEVYPGVSTIPGQFLVDACAVIVIWTKRD
jgi:hypothetical protein